MWMNGTSQLSDYSSNWASTSQFPKVLAAVVSVLGGLLVGTQSLSGFGSILAFPLAAIVLARPLYGLISIFLVINVLFIFDRTQRIGLTLPVTGGTISATDLMFALLSLCAIWKWTMDKDSYYTPNRIGTPIALLLIWSVLSLAMGVSLGNEVKKSLIEFRPVLYMSAMFFLVIFLVRNEKDLILVMKGFLWAYLATFALGFLIFVQGRKAIEYYTMGQVDPGQSVLPRFTFVSADLVLSLLFMAMGLLIFLKDQREKIYLICLCALLALNLLLIQGRTQVIALFVGMIPILVMAPGLKRIKILFSGFVGVIFLAIAIFALAQTEAGEKKIIDPILERFSGIYKAQTDVDQSMERRRMEKDAIWPKIENRPIIGNTLGAKWSNDPKWVTVLKHDPTYIHSSWLFYLFKLGLLGTFLLIFIIYRGSVLALKIVRNDSNPVFRGLALGILATLPTFAFTGLIQPTLWHFQMTPVMGFELAVVVVMDNILKNNDQYGRGVTSEA